MGVFREQHTLTVGRLHSEGGPHVGRITFSDPDDRPVDGSNVDRPANAGSGGFHDGFGEGRVRVHGGEDLLLGALRASWP